MNDSSCSRVEEVFRVLYSTFRRESRSTQWCSCYFIYTVIHLTATSRFSRDLATHLAYVTTHELVRFEEYRCRNQIFCAVVLDLDRKYLDNNRFLRILKCVFRREMYWSQEGFCRVRRPRSEQCTLSIPKIIFVARAHVSNSLISADNLNDPIERAESLSTAYLGLHFSTNQRSHQMSIPHQLCRRIAMFPGLGPSQPRSILSIAPYLPRPFR